jgi:hypothetical protein
MEYGQTKDLTDNGDAKLFATSVQVTVVFGPVLDVVGEILGGGEICEGIPFHRLNLVSDGAIQSGFVTLVSRPFFLDLVLV